MERTSPEKLSRSLATQGGQDSLIVLVVVAVIVAVVTASVPITLAVVAIEALALMGALALRTRRA
jgi:hypothetical protein